jgi:hypothetical protein
MQHRSRRPSGRQTTEIARWQHLAEYSLNLDPELNNDDRDQVAVALEYLANDNRRTPEERERLLKLAQNVSVKK